MSQSSPSPNGSRDLTGSQVTCTLVLVGVAALFVISWLQDMWRNGRAPFPYAWRDVLIVQLLCSIPLAWLAAVNLRQRLSDRRLALSALICLCVGCVPF